MKSKDDMSRVVFDTRRSNAHCKGPEFARLCSAEDIGELCVHGLADRPSHAQHGVVTFRANDVIALLAMFGCGVLAAACRAREIEAPAERTAPLTVGEVRLHCGEQAGT